MYLREYIKVFVPLLIYMGIHGTFVAPYMQSVERTDRQFAPVINEVSSAWWQGFFLQGSWQRQSPMVLQTSKGILIFQKWEQKDERRWRIYPLTILLPQEEDEVGKAENSSEQIPSRRAIFIDNPQGAEIEFREPFEFASGKPPPPIVGGQLDGDIQIYAPPHEPGGEGMVIYTSDLRIDRKQITTTRQVTLKLGGSRVVGKDLSIHLDHSLLTQPDQVAEGVESPFQGLDYLELIYVQQVEIDLPDGGLFGSKPGMDGSSEQKKPPAKAEIFCDNAFRFDFHRSVATLGGNVLLNHQVEGSPRDTFQCEQLSLRFRWLKEWTIDLIEALGANTHDLDDEKRWVRLNAPALDAKGQGRWLRIDLNLGRVAFANHLPGLPATDSSQVYLQQSTMQIWSPEIEYESETLKQTSLKPQGETERAKNNDAGDVSLPRERLGRLWSAGPGQAMVSGDDGDNWRLSWAESLQLEPKGEEDLLTIIGSANARSQNQGRFSAERVDLWLMTISEDVIGLLADPITGKSINRILPHRMHAIERAIIHAPELRAQVSDMQVWFNYPDVQAALDFLKLESTDQRATRRKKRDKSNSKSNSLENNPAAKTIDSSSPLTVPSEGNFTTPLSASPIANAFSGLAVMSKQVSGVAGDPSTLQQSMDVRQYGDQNSQRNTPAPELPMNVTGETLIAKVSQSSRKGTVIDDLSLTGIVTVTRNQISPQSMMPLTITGSQLRIDTSDQGLFDATIIGAPASIVVGDASLSGPEIRFRQRDQLVWIDHPGTFKLPKNSIETASVIQPQAQTPATQAIGFKNVPLQSQRGNQNEQIPQLLASRGAQQSSEWIEQPEVRWKGRMVFDGKTARVDGGVDVTGKMRTEVDTVWDIRATSSTLHADLLHPIEMFSQPSASPPRSRSTQPELASIRLNDSVDIQALQTSMRGVQRSIEQLNVPEIVYLPGKQHFVARGPGELRSKRMSDQDVNGLQNNRQLSLQGLHLTFDGRMEGLVANSRVTFYDHVQALLGTVIAWESLLDVNKVDQLPLGHSYLSCDELSVYNTSQLSYNQQQLNNQPSNQGAAWEISGAGRVAANSHTEKGFLKFQSQSFSYAGMTQTVSIAGAPGSPALLQQFDLQKPDAAPIEMTINEAKINLQSGVMQTSLSNFKGNVADLMDRSKSLQAAPLPAGNVGNPSGRPTASPRDSYPLRPLK